MRERGQTNSQVRDEEHRKTQSRVKAEADETEESEERLQDKVCDVVEEVECEERAGGSVKAREEVNDDVEQENSRSGERKVSEQVGDCNG